MRVFPDSVTDRNSVKSRWMITIGGKTFAMVGEPCTEQEALAFARGIWPDAKVA